MTRRKGRPRKNGHRFPCGRLRQGDIVQGDTGPVTPAQLAGAEIVETVENGVTYHKKRQITQVAILYGQGHLTARQAAAGGVLRNAWDNTMRSAGPPWTRIFVDSSPKPGDVSTLQLEAQDAWAQISKYLSRKGRGVVMAVCCYNVPLVPGFTRNEARVPIYRGMLQAELDRIADLVRMG